MKAACCKQDLGVLDNWLRMIRDVYRSHKEYLDAIGDPEERQKKLVELSTLEQALNVMKTAAVQKRRAAEMDVDGFPLPRVHGLVFDIKSGLLKRLDFNADSLFEGLVDVYGLIDGTK